MIGIWRCIRLGGAHRRQLVRGLPVRNEVDGGEISGIWGQKCESSLSAVSLRPCGPLALIPVNGKKNEIGGKIRTEKCLQCATLGSPGGDLTE